MPKHGVINNPDGRPKGSKNKFTSFKDDLIKVHEELGGWEAMIKWAKEKKNQSAFYAIMAKLLPRDVKIDTTDAHFKIIITPK